ncbi:GlxA family transcriptional regulator [Dyella soli]|uniref:GlxA family transcriptional regulator n=1 Tax=Dyella soli TaxID=522319 RepID=A0A4R0YJC0_9GAMM|nr:GlxA family transcriptional regulator [Dyella soli]TCI07322.1 GlxA family transcriptional regulator [Dyella soli]
MALPTTPLRIVLLAHENMNLLDLTGPVQTLFTANREGKGRPSARYDIVVASEHGGLITTSSGLQVMSVSLSSLDGIAIDTLVAPGGCKGEEYVVSPGLVAWVSQRAPHVRRLCSVCTGAFLLAATGQLDGRRVATHWEWAVRLMERYPKVIVDADKIFVRDESIWTSAGVTAGIDLTLALVEQDYGHQLAIDTARQLVMFMKRSGGQSQFSAPLAAQTSESDRFVELHAWVAANLDQDLRVERLAEQAGMSTRTFARTYAAKAGTTPAKMVETLRLEAVRRLLEETDLTLKRIAVMTGHGDEQNLRRVFSRRMGVNPVDYRDRFSAHGETLRARA